MEVIFLPSVDLHAPFDPSSQPSRESLVSSKNPYCAFSSYIPITLAKYTTDKQNGNELLRPP